LVAANVLIDYNCGMARRSTPTLVTYASLIHQAVREDILRGVLPPGQKLRIEHLVERYQAGSSPVREALNRLSAEGLVDRREQRGFYVAPISEADLDELVRTRCWLEELALRQAMSRASAEWHESIVVAAHRLNRTPRSSARDGFAENPEWEGLHRAFHRSLIAGCGSARLVRYCEDLADQAYRYRKLAMHSVHTGRRNIDREHQDIVRAILDGDADVAVRLLIDHFVRTAAIVRRAKCHEAAAAA
jgi:DNA-binding GntR family transcriptional regulator